eukprot:jgi/Undpi1/4427/HiC_scaffold_17.g07781.m1
MVHAPKDEMAPCQTHLFWMEDPWTRPPCEWGVRCARSHLAYAGPKEEELLRTNIALQTENSQLKRVRAYAAGVVGAGGGASDTGIARSGTSRYRQKLALFEARDPTEFSRRCVEDPSLCRSVLRVYILGGGLRTSLEGVGKAVSEDVAAGKYGSPVSEQLVGEMEVAAAAAGEGGEGAGVAVKEAPLCAMERQLIDEETTFWDDNFPGLIRERRAGAFTHVLSVIFVRGAYLYGLAEAVTHGRSIIQNNRGWTSYLAPRCRRVLAVDPAEMESSVAALPNVVHVRKMIQEARGELLGILAGNWPQEKAGSVVGVEGGVREGVHIVGGGEEHKSDFGAVVEGIAGKGVGGVVRAGGRVSGGKGEGRNNAGEEAKSKEGMVFEEEVECNGGSVQVVLDDEVEDTREGVKAHVGAEMKANAEVIRVEEVKVSGAQVKPDGEVVGAADLLVSDMNAEPQVVADVLLSAMAAGLARPGAIVVATLKDFCGRKRRMRDEVEIALRRLKAGSAADDSWDRGIGAMREGRFVEGAENATPDNAFNIVVVGSTTMGGKAGGMTVGAATAAAAIGWRLEGVETMKLFEVGDRSGSGSGASGGGWGRGSVTSEGGEGTFQLTFWRTGGGGGGQEEEEDGKEEEEEEQVFRV